MQGRWRVVVYLSSGRTQSYNHGSRSFARDKSKHFDADHVTLSCDGTTVWTYRQGVEVEEPLPPSSLRLRTALD